jgi:hypothetical protein
MQRIGISLVILLLLGGCGHKELGPFRDGLKLNYVLVLDNTEKVTFRYDKSGDKYRLVMLDENEEELNSKKKDDKERSPILIDECGHRDGDLFAWMVPFAPIWSPKKAVAARKSFSASSDNDSNPTLTFDSEEEFLGRKCHVYTAQHPLGKSRVVIDVETGFLLKATGKGIIKSSMTITGTNALELKDELEFPKK